jgi:hypothetical protein
MASALEAGLPYEQVVTIQVNRILMFLLSRDKARPRGAEESRPLVRKATQADIDWLTH